MYLISFWNVQLCAGKNAFKLFELYQLTTARKEKEISVARPLKKCRLVARAMIQKFAISVVRLQSSFLA